MIKTRKYWIRKYCISTVSLPAKEISILDDQSNYLDSRAIMAEYLRRSRKNNETPIIIAKEKYKREYLMQKDKKAYILRWNRSLICPVCDNEYLDNELEQCSVCSWNLSVYPLNPDGLRQEQENGLEWSRDIWQQLTIHKRMVSRLKTKIKDLEFKLGEPKRIEKRREELLQSPSCENFDNSKEDQKLRTFTFCIPIKLAEAIKSNIPYLQRDEWCRKHIIDAAIQERWLDAFNPIDISVREINSSENLLDKKGKLIKCKLIDLFDLPSKDREDLFNQFKNLKAQDIQLGKILHDVRRTKKVIQPYIPELGYQDFHLFSIGKSTLTKEDILNRLSKLGLGLNLILESINKDLYLGLISKTTNYSQKKELYEDLFYCLPEIDKRCLDQPLRYHLYYIPTIIYCDLDYWI